VKTRILVADDNRDSADMLVELLTLHGMVTCSAYDGAEALALARTFAPDVILLDLDMPVADGYDVAFALRDTAAPRPFLVAYTARNDAHTAARVLAAGFDGHLIKPSSLQAILATIEEGVRSRVRVSAAPDR
jgi:CheY-like chemotaxis protein